MWVKLTADECGGHFENIEVMKWIDESNELNNSL